jgi:transcriptional regulator with XRE-family HTH domain
MYDATAMRGTPSRRTTKQTTRQTTMTPTPEVGIVAERLTRAMKMRNVNATELSKETGISKAALSLLMSNQQTNTTAVNVIKLARALAVSTDYLMGLSDSDEPTPLLLGDLPLELARMAKQLPSRRQRDLLAMARTYLEMHNERDLDALMSDLLDLVAEYAGVESRDRLIDFLEREGRTKGFLTDYDEVD